MTATFEIKVDGLTYSKGFGDNFEDIKSLAAPYIGQALEDATHSLTINIKVKK